MVTDRNAIAQLRFDAAMLLCPMNTPEEQARGREYLRMANVLIVKMLARGEDVAVRSSNGTLYTRKGK